MPCTPSLGRHAAHSRERKRPEDLLIHTSTLPPAQGGAVAAFIDFQIKSAEIRCLVCFLLINSCLHWRPSC